MNTRELIEKAEALVRNTGLFIKEELGKVTASDIEAKALNSLVSYVDKEAEKMLVSGLLELTPDCGFITEEDTPDDDSKEMVWIIDPLDGTTNFLRQIPHFSVSVAFRVNDIIQLGFVYNIMLDEMFSAGNGHGAFLNGRKISVSTIELFNETIIATGFPYENRDTLPFVEILQSIMIQGRGIRRFGSAALDLAFVAAGRIDAYYECCINRWDVAAGIIIVKEAGGKISDFSGGDNYDDGKEIVATNALIHDQLLAIIQKHNV
ncbi:inositol monophosphatase family protein [Portibacter lacus]|uniref:Inositol-1-monophosphatase n=1 Tax=Portibacter lacus TaxID=1099794 RepID=A0AA37SL90_9BACT|nr:inositol monophosphatase family protein [Portibacter lacus]GLR16553.1 inositol monophosphatase [Portibacter lacus]